MAGVSSDCNELLRLVNDNNYFTGFRLQYLDKGTDGAPLTYTLKYSLTCVSSHDGSYTATSNEWTAYHSPCLTGAAYFNRITTYTNNEYLFRRETSGSSSVEKLGDTTTPTVSDWITEKTAVTDVDCPKI